MPEPTVLVVGAAEGSLGEEVVMAAEKLHAVGRLGVIYSAGISNEPNYLDLRNSSQISEVLADIKPDIVVCTAGVNIPTEVVGDSLVTCLESSFEVNVSGVMDLLRHFVYSPVRPRPRFAVKKFVAISSNSAHIARRNSVAYCASKAALSMALRVAGRELSGRGVFVWGYEPGLLRGTPMTKSVTERLDPLRIGSDLPMHRMPGVHPEGLHPASLAHRIVHDIVHASMAYNGVLFPFDAGEQ